MFAPQVYMWNMDKQAVLIGEIVLSQEPRISLYAETPIPLSREGIAVLKDKLVNLLDTRFHPSEPVQLKLPGLTVEDVATLLHCRCITVLKMVKQSKLLPISTEEGEMYFSREEVAKIAHIPIGPGLFRIVPR
jgi:hypothetical protein